ncbi:MAG: hypothetical protein WKG01_06330 [Kofleriaceae bacterium]
MSVLAIQALIRRPYLALALAMLFETIVFVAGQVDFVASDPLAYADIANRIAEDPREAFAAPSNHPFEMRIGLTLPLALLYRAFGVSTLVTNLPCLFGALGILMVVYAAAPTPRAKLLGMLFGVACVPLARHVNLLTPDLPCAALMALSVLCLSRRDLARGSRWVIAGMIAWFAAFLVKEAAIWCAPVWFYVVVRDLREAGWRSAARMFAPAIVVGVALGAVYLVLCLVVWGNALARFAGIQELTDSHTWSMSAKPTSEWVARLTWQPPVLLFKMFGAALIPVVLAAWLVRGPARIWWVATASITLIFWFGSASMSSFELLPMRPRMVLPILPGILVLAALATDRGLDRIKRARWRTAVVIGLVLAIAVPSARPLTRLITSDAPETAAYAVLRDELADPNRRIVLVCADHRCVWISSFYFGFDVPPNLTVVFAPDFARAPLPALVTVRALVNLDLAGEFRTGHPSADMAAPIEAVSLSPLFKRSHVRLYDAGDGARLWTALQPAP